MRKLTVGSLFAGIGGFDLGFQRAGFEIKWQVEIDSFCQQVLTKHFPNAKRYGDIRQVGSGREYGLETVDVICGGFPCQDISIAGNGAGINGSRSGLWREFRRLIGELRPGYVVIENVSEILRRGLVTVLRDLAELGYDAEWENIPASALGAPHQRERIWIVAYSNSQHVQGFFRKCSKAEGGRDAEEEREKNGIRPYVGAEAFRGAPCHRPEDVSSRLASVDDGFPAWLLPRAAKAIGNAVYPVIAEIIARAINTNHHQAERRAA